MVSPMVKAMLAAIGSLTYWRFKQVAFAAAAWFAQKVLLVITLESLVGDIFRLSPSLVRVQAAKPGVCVTVAVDDR